MEHKVQPPYMDETSESHENDFTIRITTILEWNSLHLTRMLTDQDGFTALAYLLDEKKQLMNQG